MKLDRRVISPFNQLSQACTGDRILAASLKTLSWIHHFDQACEYNWTNTVKWYNAAGWHWTAAGTLTAEYTKLILISEGFLKTKEHEFGVNVSINTSTDVFHQSTVLQISF